MDDIPPITGDTARTAEVARSLPLGSGADLKAIRATFGLALHMHQPTVLADGERTTAPLISNLQYMLDHPGQGDNHNAPVFLRCYGRVADLVGAGLQYLVLGPVSDDPAQIDLLATRVMPNFA